MLLGKSSIEVNKLFEIFIVCNLCGKFTILVNLLFEQFKYFIFGGKFINCIK